MKTKILIILLLSIFIFPIKVKAIFLCSSNPIKSQCASFSYSEWGECSDEGIKSRNVTGMLPKDCCIGSIIGNVKRETSMECIPVCKSYSYSSWNNKCINGEQTRTVLEKLPSGCEGELEDKLELSKECIACTGRIYSNWGDCVDGIQERVVLQKTPSNCIGEPKTEEILIQSCGEYEEEVVIEIEKDRNEIKEDITKEEKIKEAAEEIKEVEIKEEVVNQIQTIAKEAVVEDFEKIETEEENNITTDSLKIEEKLEDNGELIEIVEKPSIVRKVFGFVKNIFSKLKFW